MEVSVIHLVECYDENCHYYFRNSFFVALAQTMVIILARAIQAWRRWTFQFAFTVIEILFLQEKEENQAYS